MASATPQRESNSITQLHELTLRPYQDDVPLSFQVDFNKHMSILEGAVNQLSESDVAATSDVHTLFKTCRDWYNNDAYKVYQRLIVDNLCTCGFVKNVIKYFEQLDKSELFKGTTLKSSDLNVTTKIFSVVLGTLHNFTDASVKIGSQLAKKRNIRLLLNFLTHDALLPGNLPDIKWRFVTKVLGTILNMARLCPDSRQLLRENDAIQILSNYSQTKNKLPRIFCYLVMSYIITVEGVELLEDTRSTIKCLIELLSIPLVNGRIVQDDYTYSPTEILLGLNNLALNDSNKLKIVRCGGLQMLSKITEDNDNITIYIMAAELTWKLAFKEQNRQKIKEEKKLLKALNYWDTSLSRMLKEASSGALWETFEHLQHGTSVSGLFEKQLTHGPHVMLSYQWEVQPTMTKLKEKLQEAGYNVWMDVDRMGGYILEAMASAVENAAVVLIAVSKKYRDSPNCRTEGNYAHKRQKPIIPLIVESNYEADGWLGALTAGLLYFNLTCVASVDEEFQNIQKEIGNRGFSQVMNKPSDEVDSPQTCVFSWTTDDVKEWLKENNLADYNSCLEEVNGEMLVQMVKLSKKAPDFFYSQLKLDFKLNIIQILKFANALDKLKV